MATRVLKTVDSSVFSTVASLPVPVRNPAVAVQGATIWIFGV
jgi:hypothetical protein